MKQIHLQKSFFSSPIAFICNLALVYLAYGICRVAYLLENWTALSEGFDTLSLWEALKGCWMFDTSAILYTNALYAILMLFPLHYKEKDGWQIFVKWIYMIINSVCICANLIDAVYFQYTGRRTTASIFQEFSNEGNIGEVFGIEHVDEIRAAHGSAGMSGLGLLNSCRSKDSDVIRRAVQQTDRI